jgi:hypothetical protein
LRPDKQYHLQRVSLHLLDRVEYWLSTQQDFLFLFFFFNLVGNIIVIKFDF